MSTNDIPLYKYTNLSASAQIPGAVFLGGIFCASASTGTVKVWDNTTATAPILINTTSLTAGQWYPMPAVLRNGLFITIGGTADTTVFWL